MIEATGDMKDVLGLGTGKAFEDGSRPSWLLPRVLSLPQEGLTTPCAPQDSAMNAGVWEAGGAYYYFCHSAARALPGMDLQE